MKFPWTLLVAAAIVCVSVFHSVADSDPLPEYRVKAALLYKLSKFIEWPTDAFANSASPFRICVVGKNPFGSALDAIEGKAVGGRKIAIQHVHASELTEEACQVIFVSTSEHSQVETILRAVMKRPVLTVSDIEGFAKHGGIMNLITRNNRVRFAVNLESSKRAGLLISAQLLELALVVGGNRAKEDY